MPKTEFDFSSQSLADWNMLLKRKICNLPYTPNTNADSIEKISKFYTQLLDYLINPKNEERNTICLYKGFIQDNLFTGLCDKHDGLFELIKIEAGRLRKIKYCKKTHASNDQW